MRAPVIALLCGLVAAVALLAWRGGGADDERQAARPVPASAPVAEAPASSPAPLAVASSSPLPVSVPAGQAPIPASVASAAAAKPPLLAASPVRSTFALSSDHRALIQETLLATADHAQLEREPRDDGWATAAERLIRQELAAQGKAGDFDVIAVDCRQTLCAIQAFSYGENGQREWVKAFDDLYKQSLSDDFDSVNTAFPTQGNRSAVLTFLHRKPVVPKP